jgi:hypothetical protein
MKIALQIRANCTDEDLLLKSILKNSEVLAKHGIAHGAQHLSPPDP